MNRSKKMNFLIGALSWVMLVPMGYSDQGSQTIQVEAKSKKYEVNIDPSQRRVIVSVIKGGKEVPKHVLITLTDVLGKRVDLDLKAQQPRTQPVTYQGALGPSSQPYVGFELTIPLRLEPALSFKGPINK